LLILLLLQEPSLVLTLPYRVRHRFAQISLRSFEALLNLSGAAELLPSALTLLTKNQAFWDTTIRTREA
jgi:hypothetical protein